MDRAPEVVYRIPCAKCPSSYIGGVKRNRQHKNDTSKQNRERSATDKRCKSADHKTDSAETAILEMETNWKMRPPQSLNGLLGMLLSVYTHQLHSPARGFARDPQH